MNNNIRVGLIRCDTHGLWFAAMMAEHDPLLLQRPTEFDKNQAYSWQGGGVHRFFYTNYGDPTLMTAPFVGGFTITKIWDKHREAAEQARAVLLDGPIICDSPDECSDDVDLVLIADCNLDGADHLELAMPGLKKGVATFVDKPFASTVAQCRTLVDAAAQNGAPIFSATILRFEPAVAAFRDRILSAGEVNYANITGAGDGPEGLVHSIGLVQHLFGGGISTVQVLANPKQTAIWLDYDQNPNAPQHGVMIHTQTGTRRFPSALGASVIGTRDDIHTLIPGGYAYPWGTAEIIKVIKQMLKSRQSPAELGDMIEGIAVMEAFRESRSSGRAVRVADFL